MCRSNQQRCCVKKDVPGNFENFTGKHLCLKACNFIKKKLQHKCFPVKFAKFLRAATLKNMYEKLPLHLNIFCQFSLDRPSPKLTMWWVRYLIPFVQFKKREKQSSVFHVFWMVPNCVTHHNLVVAIPYNIHFTVYITQIFISTINSKKWLYSNFTYPEATVHRSSTK